MPFDTLHSRNNSNRIPLARFHINTNQGKERWRNAVRIRWVEEGARLCALFAAEESFAGVAAELVVGDGVLTLTGFDGRHLMT